MHLSIFFHSFQLSLPVFSSFPTSSSKFIQYIFVGRIPSWNVSLTALAAHWTWGGDLLNEFGRVQMEEMQTKASLLGPQPGL